MQQKNILISACLLGNPVRYDGTGKHTQHPLIQKWQRENRLISICPEVAGGLGTPRAAAEIIQGNGINVLKRQASVINNQDIDVTEAFLLGAQKALAIAMENHCAYAILTERSPSCGSQFIHDGSFSGNIIEGMGVTSALLEKNGIRVFNQDQLEVLERLL